MKRIPQWKLDRIVKHRLPRGWTLKIQTPCFCSIARVVHYHSPFRVYGVLGEMYDHKVIYCLPIIDVGSLFTFLHEVGHMRCGHADTDDLPGWLMEYEAENWAIAAMRAEKIPVPKKIIRHAKWNVKNFVDEAEDDEVIDVEVLKFAYGNKWRGKL